MWNASNAKLGFVGGPSGLDDNAQASKQVDSIRPQTMNICGTIGGILSAKPSQSFGFQTP